MADPQRWLTRQILTGRIRARKIGRQWRMTDDDIAYALDVFANIPSPGQASTRHGMTKPEDVQGTPAGLPELSPRSARAHRQLSVVGE